MYNGCGLVGGGRARGQWHLVEGGGRGGRKYRVNPE